MPSYRVLFGFMFVALMSLGLYISAQNHSANVLIVSLMILILLLASLPAWPQEEDDSSYVVNASPIHDMLRSKLLVGEKPSPELLAEAKAVLKRLEAHKGGDIGRWAETLTRDLAPFRD